MRAQISFSTLLLLPSLAAISACTPSNIPATPIASKAAPSDAAMRGRAFAQAHCASCHAIADGTSPHADAPAFADVINQPDLSEKTLNPWLRNSHNFPQIMNFEIQADHIDDLAAHMLTLKDPKHKPRI